MWFHIYDVHTEDGGVFQLELKQSLWSNLQNPLHPQEFKLELSEYGGDPLKTPV